MKLLVMAAATTRREREVICLRERLRETAKERKKERKGERRERVRERQRGRERVWLSKAAVMLLRQRSEEVGVRGVFSQRTRW